MSAFLGAQLNHILDAIEKGDAADASSQKIIDLGIGNLPRIEKDATDRNRTSPFAFTGNKFEFRAVGSSQPIALPLTVINAAVAEALDGLNAKLEAELKAGKEHKAAVLSVVRQAIIETKAIRFEGNGYSEEWKAEAERRGLPHAKDTVAALHIWEQPAVKAVLAKPGILSEGEQESRLHIRHEEYQKVIAIETQVLRQMAETQILPSVTADLGARADSLGKLAAAGIAVPETLKAALQAQATLTGEAQARLAAMKAALAKAEALEDLHARTEAFGTEVNQSKHALREVLDALEDACDADLWPLPKYWQLLSPLL